MTTPHTEQQAAYTLRALKINQTRTGIMEAGSGAQVATMRDGWPVADIEAYMVALVHRYNSHDALVAALEGIVELEKRADGLRGAGMVDDPDRGAMRGMARAARAALAQARGQQ